MQFNHYLIAITALLLTLSACDSDKEKAAEESPEQVEPAVVEEQVEEQVEEEVELHPIWGAWSPEEDLEALQGEWVTMWGAEDEVQTRWKIDGTDAIFEQKGREAREGTIELEHPGVLRFSYEVDGGTQGTVTSFTREGDDLYMGLGMSGVVLEDRMVMRSSNNLVVYKDEACTFHKSSIFQGFEEEGVEMECDIVEENDENYFTFTTPDEREISLNQRIKIGEHSLVDNQLRSNLLHRVEQ